MRKKNKPASPASASRATASIPHATGPPDLTPKELARAWRPSDIAARRRAEELLQEALTAPAAGSRRELRRQQARGRREVLTRQANIALEAQPRLLDLRDFKRAERLAIRHKDRELERFLLRRAKEGVRHWMRLFRRYRSAGRPRGTGHPKARLGSNLPASVNIARLKRAGLKDADLKVFFACINAGGNFTAASKELGVTPQAVHKRYKKNIEPVLRRMNPRFSRQALRHAAADLTTK